MLEGELKTMTTIATPLIQKLGFLKERVVWEQSDEIRKCWKENFETLIQSPLITKEVPVCNYIYAKS